MSQGGELTQHLWFVMGMMVAENLSMGVNIIKS